jgi:acyl carrier protein
VSDIASSAEIERQVVRIVTMCLPRGLASKEVTRTQRLKDDLGLDSLGLMSLAFRLEDALSLELSSYTDALRALVTVDDLIRFVTRFCPAGA